MSGLRMFACREGSPVLWEIDDDATFTDDGAAIEAVAETHPVDFGGSMGYGRFREAAQWVAPGNTCTVTLTPIVDGQRVTEQAHIETLSVTGGPEQRIEAPFAVPGARFGMEVRVTAHDALTELGEADIGYIEQRRHTGKS